jgi:hypothetical protein
MHGNEQVSESNLSDQFASSESLPVPVREPTPEPSALVPVQRLSAMDESYKFLWQPVLDAKGGGSVCNALMWEILDKVLFLLVMFVLPGSHKLCVLRHFALW